MQVIVTLRLVQVLIELTKEEEDTAALCTDNGDILRVGAPTERCIDEPYVSLTSAVLHFAHKNN